MSDTEYTQELEDTIVDAAKVFREFFDRLAVHKVDVVQMDERVAALLPQAEFIEARRANPVASLLEEVDRETRRKMRGDGAP